MTPRFGPLTHQQMHDLKTLIAERDRAEHVLRRIAEHEVRAHRAGRRLVDIDEVNTLRRIARVALRERTSTL